MEFSLSMIQTGSKVSEQPDQPEPAIIILDDGTGGTQVFIPEGQSTEISVDDRPAVVLTNQPGGQDIGFLYAPVVSGEPTVGAELSLDLGVVYFQGDGPISIVQDILRNGLTVLSDIRTSDAPEVYAYIVDPADTGQTVQLRSTLTNGTNVVEILTDIVMPTSLPILTAGANAWLDFGDDTTITRGGSGNERLIGATDKTGNGNDIVDPPDTFRRAWCQTTDTINGRRAVSLRNSDMLLASPIPVKEFFVVIDAPDGATNNIAPILGDHFTDSTASHSHAFLREGGTDYDLSLDGAAGGDTDGGTVWTDSGLTGSGGNLSITGLTPAKRDGLNLWRVRFDGVVNDVDVVGSLRSGSNTLRNDGTLIGEVVTFPADLTTAQANAVGSEIAARWGISLVAYS